MAEYAGMGATHPACDEPTAPIPSELEYSDLLHSLGGVDVGAQQRAASADMRASARWYALTVGWHVFPLMPGGKTPAYPKAHPDDQVAQKACKGACGELGHGLYDATRDPEVIDQMWQRYPGAGIGTPTGLTANGRGEAIGCGFDVIDIDPPDGFTSFHAVRHSFCAPDCSSERWCPAIGPLPPLLGISTTPRGGRHFWTPATGGGNTSNEDLHIDLRRDGGYVALPPTGRNGGYAYTWIKRPT
jgi:hypothetical protein